MLRASSPRSPPRATLISVCTVIVRTGRPALLAAALLVLLALCRPGAALAQDAPIQHEILYTRAGAPAGQASLRRAVLRFQPAPTPLLSIVSQTDAGPTPLTQGGAGLCLAPDGDVLVAGGAAAPNAVYRYRPHSGAATAFSPGAGSPVALRIAVEPGGERAFVPCTVGGIGRVARMPLSPAGNGIVHSVTGADSSVTSIGFAHARAYYVNESAGALGTLNPETLATTRLLAGLDRPREVMLDPFTGHLIIFGAVRAYQIDARPGLAAPVIISETDLTGIAPSFSLVGASIDGAGRAVMLSTTGHVAMLDYRATRAVGHSANPRAAAMLESVGAPAGLAPLCGPGGLRSGGCLWDNGPFDLLDGLASRNSPMHGDARAADDFYLPPGVHRIDSISATMFSDAIALTGLIEIYDDCNGRPGTILGSFAATGNDTGGLFQGLRVVRLSAATTGLWLRGGRTYWVSPVGIGNLQGTDMWYWGTSSGPVGPDGPPDPATIRGRPGAFKSVAAGIPEWVSSDLAGCACSDFAFELRGISCKVLHDNGPPVDAPPQPPTAATIAPGAPSIISSTNTDARAADNFRVPPCLDGGVNICYIEATVYTNCTPVRGTAEVFGNDCVLPLSPPLFVGAISRATPLGYSVWIGGAAMPAYRVQVDDPGWFLPDGRNYWLSVAVQGSGGFSQRAYFAGNAPDCDDPPGCGIRISQAAVRGTAVGSGAWVPIESALQTPLDLSFMVAVSDPESLSSAGDLEPPPACIADADGDGVVAVADIFHFLSAWFAGCP